MSGYRIDNLQYANWSEKIFRQMREGGVDGIHVTIAYHENLREMISNIGQWNAWFEQFGDLIMPGRTAADLQIARETGRTAIFFGLQTASPIEDDIRLIEIIHQLGVRFMQLTYNNQSLLASGCYESDDTGLTRFGHQAVKEMNRVGLVVDMSHSGDRSTLEAIETSSRPIAITHANPDWWHPALRNKSDEIISALVEKGGMLGFSVYPHHLKDGSACSLQSFSEMIAESAKRYGAANLGIGTDLCQDHPDSVVEWMRNGRWSKAMDYGEGSKDAAGFPNQPHFFKDNRDFRNFETGLLEAGLSQSETQGILGDNWARFYAESFEPQ